MAYHGLPGSTFNIGLKPTDADREFVKTLSLMGIGVRDICVRLGERFNLGKPLSRQSLYWHFRKELLNKKRGRKLGKEKLTVKMKNNMLSEMDRMIQEIKQRRG